MTRLILDYYRRWSVALSIGMALQLIQGWWITTEPRTPIEFTSAIIPIFMGLFLLLFDLSRGVVRVVGTLPLPLAKIGRGWWLANVLIPASVLTALLFLGAGASAFCHWDQAFPLNRLTMASLLTSLWLGTMFFLIFPAIFPTSRKFRNRRLGVFTVFVGLLLAVVLVFWMILGFVLSPGAANNPIKLAIFVAGGTCLTIVGWFRAGRFDPARAQFDSANTELAATFDGYKAGATDSRPAPLSTASHQPPEGRGGILFLLRTTFIDSVLVCFAGAIGILLFAWSIPGQGVVVINLRHGLKIDNSAITMLLIFTFFPLRPSLMQLRFLRTLPISTAKLTVMIIASVILPAIAVGMLMAAVAGLSIGASAALTILKNGILILGPMTLGIFFAVWRGGGVQAYALFLVPMMVWVLAASASQNITFPLAGAVTVAGVLLAWLLTYYALLRGGRAYRVRTNLLGSFTWNARR